MGGGSSTATSSSAPSSVAAEAAVATEWAGEETVMEATGLMLGVRLDDPAPAGEFVALLCS